MVTVRTGVVQSPAGGALKAQLPLFLAGLGGRLGSGDQWLSWISLDDVVGLFAHAVLSPGLHSPVFLQKARVFMHPDKTEILCRALAFDWPTLRAMLALRMQIC